MYKFIKDFKKLRNSIIEYLSSSDWVDICIPTMRVVDDSLIVCNITSIENGVVYYDDDLDDDLSFLTMNELYDIIDYLNDTKN